MCLPRLWEVGEVGPRRVRRAGDVEEIRTSEQVVVAGCFGESRTCISRVVCRCRPEPRTTDETGNQAGRIVVDVDANETSCS
jgi:hypothetical protein